MPLSKTIQIKNLNPDVKYEIIAYFLPYDENGEEIGRKGDCLHHVFKTNISGD